MLLQEKILVIIPVLNEEDTITNVIKSLHSYGLTQIMVVDNGSTDKSVEKSINAGATVILEPIPGYGRACWRGIQNTPVNFDWILFCDGDGSDDLKDLPKFLEATNKYDLILGDRRATKAGRTAMTPVQNFGNKLATFLIGLGWGYWYQDLGPLRLIRKSSLDKIGMQDRGFGWTVEMQARAIECGLKIIEIPVGYRRRQGGRSKISGTIKGSFQAGTIILATLGKLYLKSFWKKEERRQKAEGRREEKSKMKKAQGKKKAEGRRKKAEEKKNLAGGSKAENIKEEKGKYSAFVFQTSLFHEVLIVDN